MKPRLLASIAAAASVAAVLAGCVTDPRSTEGGVDGLEQVLADVPEAGDVSVFAGNNEPWTGEGRARGSVQLDELSDSRLKTVVDRVGGFLADERGSSVDWNTVTLTTDGIALEVTDRRDVNDELRDAFAQIDPESGFTYADLDRSVYVTSSNDDVVGTFDQFAQVLSSYREIGSEGLQVDSDDDAASFTIWVRDPQDRPDDAIAAYESLLGQFDIVAADIARYRVEITVDPSEVKEAERAVAALHLGEELTVAVIGGHASDDSSS